MKIQSFPSAPGREQETKYSYLPREWTLAMLSWYSLALEFTSTQGLIKQLPKVRGRGACISCRVCCYSRFSGMARPQPGVWHSYIESCLQYINELEFSLAWSVSTFTPTVLKEFPICFFPLIREPLGHNRAFWDVQQALKFCWVRRGEGYFDPLGRQPSTSQMRLQAGQ